MMLSSATNGESADGAHDDPAARQALADVVVGVALEPQRDARRQERAEALARRAGERDLDRVVGQAGAAVPGGELVAEHRADRAVDVADRQLERDRLTVLERALAQLDQRVVERPVEPVVLGLRAVPVLRPTRRTRARAGSA